MSLLWDKTWLFFISGHIRYASCVDGRQDGSIIPTSIRGHMVSHVRAPDSLRASSGGRARRAHGRRHDGTLQTSVRMRIKSKQDGLAP
eukprot:9342523-Pyramimonas_sp.AAC.1